VDALLTILTQGLISAPGTPIFQKPYRVLKRVRTKSGPYHLSYRQLRGSVASPITRRAAPCVIADPDVFRS
jgi:hypothetical protein